MTKQALEPTHFPFFDYKSYSFSLGLQTPSGIWLSGHTASEHAPATKTMIIAAEGDLVAQARVSHAKIQATLQASGLDLSHVVAVVVLRMCVLVISGKLTYRDPLALWVTDSTQLSTSDTGKVKRQKAKRPQEIANYNGLKDQMLP